MNITNLQKEINQTTNVAIFCDYDNIYYGLTEYGIDVTAHKYDVFYIMNQLYDIHRIRTMNAYADFEQILIPNILKHLQLNRVQIHNVFGNQLRNDLYRKNASDIELSIQAMETFYKYPNIDTFVFITSDSDMINIMNKLMYKGKTIHLYHIKQNSNEYISKFCNMCIDLVELMEIDINRKNPEYWINTIKNIIIHYCENTKYDNKLISHKNLLNSIQRETFMSLTASNRLINRMLDLYVIEKVEYGQYFGYKLKGRD